MLLFLALRGDKTTTLLLANERKRASTFAINIVGRLLTVWEALQKGNHYTKRLRSTTFVITKFEH